MKGSFKFKGSYRWAIKSTSTERVRAFLSHIQECVFKEPQTAMTSTKNWEISSFWLALSEWNKWPPVRKKRMKYYFQWEGTTIRIGVKMRIFKPIFFLPALCQQYKLSSPLPNAQSSHSATVCHYSPRLQQNCREL